MKSISKFVFFIVFVIFNVFVSVFLIAFVSVFLIVFVSDIRHVVVEYLILILSRFIFQSIFRRKAISWLVLLDAGGGYISWLVLLEGEVVTGYIGKRAFA